MKSAASSDRKQVMRDRGDSVGIIGRNERKRAKIGAEIVGSCWGRCRSVPMSNVVRALHKRWQATGYDWERLLAVEMCRAGVGESVVYSTNRGWSSSILGRNLF